MLTSEQKERIDQLFKLWQRGLCPGGQVVIRHRDQLVYDRCFGYANVELEVPVTDETVFHVASVSKQLAVMAIMLLHEDGRLHIDDDIRQHIPEQVNFPQPVTIRQLMNNVSGVRDIWTLSGFRGVRIDDTITQPDAVRIISRQRGLNFEPGDRYMYSNSNFVYLAEIAEKVAGCSLTPFLQERVFAPLGMTSSCFRETYWQLIPKRATSYRDMGGGFAHNVLNYGSYGSTSLHTTAKDFLKWMTTFRKPAICKPETLQIMMTAPTLNDGNPSSYAGGLMVGELDGKKYVQHGGSDASFRSFIMCFPEEELDIVIFANTANIPPGGAAFAIARIFFGLPEPEAKPLERYVEAFDQAEAPGFYYSNPPEVATVIITAKEGTLYLQDNYGQIPLQHSGGNKYTSETGPMALLLGATPALVMGNDETPLTKASSAGECSCYLQGYVGTYYNEEVDARYTVTEEEGLLYIDHFRHFKRRLYLYKRDHYITGGGAGSCVEFVRGSGGEVLGFKFHSGRVQNLGFTKQ